MTRSSPTDEDFAALVHACWPGLYRTAYLMLGNAAEAEDLVQTAFARTFASWHRVRSLEAAPAYARTTMMNVAASWFRKKGWRNERPTATLPETVVEGEDLTDRHLLREALAVLPPRQRAMVVLRYYEDLSVAEVANTLGITTGGVKSQTSAALRRLRAVLGDDLLPERSQS